MNVSALLCASAWPPRPGTKRHPRAAPVVIVSAPGLCMGDLVISSRIASVESIELAEPRKRRCQGDRESRTTRPLSPRGATRRPGRGLTCTAAFRARLGPKVDIRRAARCLLLTVVGLWGIGWLAPPVWAGNASGVQKVPSDLTALSLEQLYDQGHVGFQKRARPSQGRGGHLRHHPRRPPPFRGDQHSRGAAHGSGRAGGAD